MFKVFTDSACDLPQTYIDKYKITRLPFSITFDGNDFQYEIEELSIETFYQKLTSSKVFPKTSQVTIQEYEDQFFPVLSAGYDILVFTLSSHFSGSYQSAVNAAKELGEQFPERSIIVIDSAQATGGQGLLVLEACRMRKAGLSIEETRQRIEMMKQDSRIFFTLDTLEYLQKGGRIGKASALAGTILNLKPVIQLKDGELLPIGTVRGIKKAYQKIVAEAHNYFLENGFNIEEYQFVFCHGITPKEGDYLKDLANKSGFVFDLEDFLIGATIGTNTGPSGIGIAFVKKYEYIAI